MVVDQRKGVEQLHLGSKEALGSSKHGRNRHGSKTSAEMNSAGDNTLNVKFSLYCMVCAKKMN